MYEIPFGTKNITVGPDEEEQLVEARAQTARRAELVAIAEKLIEAGWTVEWTVTGLAFELPEEELMLVSKAQESQLVQEKLAALGIKDEFRMRCSRSINDIIEAKMEYDDRVFCADAGRGLRQSIANEEEDDWNGLQLIKYVAGEILRTADRYGDKDVLVRGDRERGVLAGRSHTFAWLFGEDWASVSSVKEQDDNEDKWSEGWEYDWEASCETSPRKSLQELLFKDEKKKEPPSGVADAEITQSTSSA
jgi:hypothetical protein